MKTLQRAAIIFFVLLLVTACKGKTPSVLTSEGASATPAASPSQIEDSLFNEPGTLPVFKETVKLTIGVPALEKVDFDTNYYSLLLQEKANAELTFVIIPDTSEVNYKNKLAIMIATETPLPDIIIAHLSYQEISCYGSQGVFIPLNEYYEKSSYYIKKYIDSGDSIYLPYITSPDGNIYGIPRIAPEIGDEWAYRSWINKTWLDYLGLPMPETTDDYYNVLKAFKEQDPNQNNKADEIPLIGSINGWNRQHGEYLMNSFIYCNIGGDSNALYLLVDENKKLYPAYITPQWRAGLEYMNKLCSEGLMSPLSFTQSDTAFKKIIENEEIQLVGSFPSGSLSVYKDDSIRKRDMLPMPPLTGPDGACYATHVTTTIRQSFFITKYCNNPEAAFRLGDLMWEEELSITNRFGKQGEHWEYYKGEEKGLYHSLGIPATLKIIQNVWSQSGHNANWNDRAPGRRTDAMGTNGQVWDGDPYSFAYMTAQAVPLYIGKVPDEVVMNINYTEEEWNQICDIHTSLAAYVTESRTRFIMGDLPLSEWDNYLREFNAIGLDKYLEVTQKAYDRMMGR